MLNSGKISDFGSKRRVKIELSEAGLAINGARVNFPIEVAWLSEILGEPRLTHTKYSEIYTYDELGLQGYCKQGTQIYALLVCFEREEYPFSPRQAFTGEITLDAQEARAYRAAQPNERIRTFEGDRGGAIVRAGVSYWYSIKQSAPSVVQAIQIEAVSAERLEYVAKNHVGTLPKSVAQALGISAEPAKPEIDAKYAYLEPMWQQWVEQVGALVPAHNRYYNLVRGIDEVRASNGIKFSKKLVLPDELLNFYKIYNVSYNAVTSAFSFSIDGEDYVLIGFDELRHEYDNLRELICEYAQSGTLKHPRDPRLEYTGYASRAWIPVAHNYSGDYLLYDTAPSTQGAYGQIIKLQNENWQRRVVASSLTELIKDEIERLKSGKTEKFSFILKEDNE